MKNKAVYDKNYDKKFFHHVRLVQGVIKIFRLIMKPINQNFFISGGKPSSQVNIHQCAQPPTPETSNLRGTLTRHKCYAGWELNPLSFIYRGEAYPGKLEALAAGVEPGTVDPGSAVLSLRHLGHNIFCQGRS
jgi:hypothetical protein